MLFIRKRKKNLKMNFFFLKENVMAPEKANEMVEICWGISSVIYKKKES